MESMDSCITSNNLNLLMKKNPTLRTLLILCIVFLIVYALADGIKYGSTWGVVMAIVSLLALYIFIRLARKLSQINEIKEEEDQQLPG